MSDKKSTASLFYREYQYEYLFYRRTLLLSVPQSYLADHTVFNEELCNWLRDELELVHLAAKLKQNLERNVSVEDMIYPVFKVDQLPYL